MHGPLSCRPESEVSTGGNFWPAGDVFGSSLYNGSNHSCRQVAKQTMDICYLAHTRKARQDQTEDWQAVRKGRWAQGMRRLLLTLGCGRGWLVATSPGEGGSWREGQGQGIEGQLHLRHTVFEERLLYQGSPPRGHAFLV